MITIIGSMRFYDIMREQQKAHYLANCAEIVIMPTKKCKTKIEAVKRMCMMIMYSDIVLVCNKDGYIGNDTRFEIELAERLKKEIRYLEQPDKRIKEIIDEF